MFGALSLQSTQNGSHSFIPSASKIYIVMPIFKGKSQRGLLQLVNAVMELEINHQLS